MDNFVKLLVIGIGISLIMFSGCTKEVDGNLPDCRDMIDRPTTPYLTTTIIETSCMNECARVNMNAQSWKCTEESKLICTCSGSLI